MLVTGGVGLVLSRINAPESRRVTKQLITTYWLVVSILLIVSSVYVTTTAAIIHRAQQDCPSPLLHDLQSTLVYAKGMTLHK